MITEKEAFNTEFNSLKGTQCLVWWKCGGFLKSVTWVLIKWILECSRHEHHLNLTPLFLCYVPWVLIKWV
jgi:hypothetical protein